MRKFLIEDQAAIEDIIRKAKVCTLAMCDGDKPYAVPMNFGYHDGIIYLHSAHKGIKMDILKANNKVCVSFYVDDKLHIRHEQIACSYSMKFRSVLAFGQLEFITDHEEKEKGMNEIMKQYSGRSFTYNPYVIKGVSVMKVMVDKFTGFNRGYNEPE